MTPLRDVAGSGIDLIFYSRFEKGRIHTCTRRRISVLNLFSSFIMLCRRDTVALGGTHEEGVRHRSINAEQRQRIWDGCCQLIPSLQVDVILIIIMSL